jgi:FkbM family methyltransferase
VAAIRKYKRLHSVLYDLFLFVKSKIIKPVTLPYNKYSLLACYIRYVLKYIITKEFIRTPKYQGPQQTTLLHFKLSCVTYGSMFVMFNEIFGHEVYKFSADNNQPFIIDCGSNIGLAILYFKACYPHAEIIGFEPSPETFDILQKNVTNNHLSSVTAHNKAVHNTEEKITFYSCKENAANGGWSVQGTTHQAYQKYEQSIDATPLSPYITKPVDLLKMDIEGAENLVIEELAHSGKLKLIKQMILEYHHHMVNLQEDHLAPVLKIFEDNGFGYQFNYVEVAVPKKHNRNVLIMYVYNKAFITLTPDRK